MWREDRQRTDFAALQQRVVAGRLLPAVAAATPAHFVAFDILASSDGQDLRPRPLRERRKRLERLLAGGPVQLPVRPQTADIAQATEWMTSWLQLGIEGLVAKHADTPYLPGRRSCWVKVRARTTPPP